MAPSYPSAALGQIYLNGPEYFIVPEDILEVGRSRRANPSIAKKLFVNMGGVVQHPIFERIIHVLERLAERGIKSTFLMGFDSDVDCGKASNLKEKGVTLLRGTDRMGELLARADIALASSGYIKYELAAAGIPSVLVATVDHQVTLGRTFAEFGKAAIFAGDTHKADPADVASTVYALALDHKRRQEMSIAGRQMLDGQALRRIEDALFSTMV